MYENLSLSYTHGHMHASIKSIREVSDCFFIREGFPLSLMGVLMGLVIYYCVWPIHGCVKLH